MYRNYLGLITIVLSIEYLLIYKYFQRIMKK